MLFERPSDSNKSLQRFRKAEVVTHVGEMVMLLVYGIWYVTALFLLQFKPLVEFHNIYAIFFVASCYVFS